MQTLRKSFKLQKIMFFIYLFVVITEFIFSISFMTQYSNLFGLILPLNEGIKLFHDDMQVFNRIIFYFSLVGLISIILIYVLEINKKVCDRFALIVIGSIIVILTGSSIFSIFRLNGLSNEYKGVDFSYLYLEDPDMVNYQMRFETFNIGYVVNVVAIITFLLFISILVFNHFKYLKLKKEGVIND